MNDKECYDLKKMQQLWDMLPEIDAMLTDFLCICPCEMHERVENLLDRLELLKELEK
jgi:hypothetical protein